MSSGGASRSLPKRDEREKRDRERRERELTHALVGSVNKYRLLVASCDRAKTVFFSRLQRADRQQGHSKAATIVFRLVKEGSGDSNRSK